MRRAAALLQIPASQTDGPRRDLFVVVVVRPSFEVAKGNRRSSNLAPFRRESSAPLPPFRSASDGVTLAGVGLDDTRQDAFHVGRLETPLSGRQQTRSFEAEKCLCENRRVLRLRDSLSVPKTKSDDLLIDTHPSDGGVHHVQGGSK